MRRKLRDAVGHADGEAHRLPRRRCGCLLGDQFPQMKDLFGAGENRLPGVGEIDTASGRLEQLMSQILLQRLDLGADRLDGHVQPLRGSRKAALLGHDPEVVEVPVVQQAHALPDFANTEVGLTVALLLSRRLDVQDAVVIV
jgi:hypothetical protein